MSFPNSYESLWDDKDAARFLKSSPSTLRKARMTGSGPPWVKLGASVRYVPSLVQEYVAAQARRSTSEQTGTTLTIAEFAAAKPAASRGRPRPQSLTSAAATFVRIAWRPKPPNDWRGRTCTGKKMPGKRRQPLARKTASPGDARVENLTLCAPRRKRPHSRPPGSRAQSHCACLVRQGAHRKAIHNPGICLAQMLRARPENA